MFKKTPILTVLSIFLCAKLSAQNNAEALTQALEKHYQSSDLPGFAVAIVNENGTLYQHGLGYADLADQRAFNPDMVQNLGSVSKTIVGLALVKAVEAGKLSMDDPINDILPFPVINPRHKDVPILVRHLATHTSSILDSKHYGKSYVYAGNGGEGDTYHQGYLHFLHGHEQMSLRDFLYHILHKEGKWYKKKNFLKAAPGTSREYSNLNAALAAFVIEQATGVPFREFTREKIFKPLGMETTTWQYENVDEGKKTSRYFPVGQRVPAYSLITYPDGGLYTSVEELSLLLVEMIKAYQGESDYLPAPYHNMLLPGDEDESRAFWGMGQTSRNIGHGGSDPGVQTDMQFNADRKIGRIIFTNVNAEDNEQLWEQYRGIHEILAEFEDQIARQAGQ